MLMFSATNSVPSKASFAAILDQAGRVILGKPTRLDSIQSGRQSGVVEAVVQRGREAALVPYLDESPDESGHA